MPFLPPGEASIVPICRARSTDCAAIDDKETAHTFSSILAQAGRIDILVNSAWGGYERISEDGRFTWALPFGSGRFTGVAVISLYPGLVRTESVVASGAFDLSNSESPEFSGRVIAALARDPQLMERSGKAVAAAQAAAELGVADIDGKRPVPLSLDRL